jgi:hypothetical protein
MKETFDFGRALELLKAGHKVARKGWNDKGIYLELQKPDEHSKMTLPYIYIVTTKLVTDNPDVPKGIMVRGVVPWLASQTDMLAEDWVKVD